MKYRISMREVELLQQAARRAGDDYHVQVCATVLCGHPGADPEWDPRRSERGDVRQAAHYLADRQRLPALPEYRVYETADGWHFSGPEGSGSAVPSATREGAVGLCRLHVGSRFFAVV